MKSKVLKTCWGNAFVLQLLLKSATPRNLSWMLTNLLTCHNIVKILHLFFIYVCRFPIIRAINETSLILIFFLINKIYLFIGLIVKCNQLNHSWMLLNNPQNTVESSRWEFSFFSHDLLMCCLLYTSYSINMHYDYTLYIKTHKQN